MVVCKNCGAFMRFDPGTQRIKCDHCDSEVSPVGIRVGDESGVTTVPDDDNFEAEIYTCPQCGGDIVCDDDTAATFCSYCGASSVVLSRRLEKIRKPRCVIPFKLTKEECFENYKKTLKKAIFAPSYLKNTTLIEKLRGIYMPYWIYDVKHEGGLYMTGKRQHRSGDYLIVENYSISSFINSDCDGLAFDASASFSDSLSRAIAPFDQSEAVDFSQAYISGFYADMCNVPARVYEDNAVSIVDKHIAKAVKTDPGLKIYDIDTSKSSGDGAVAKTEETLGYFPVWFLSCRDKSGKNVSYAVVNGQTGKVAMDLPIDYGKYILGSLLLAVPVAVVLNLFMVLSPTALLITAIVFAAVSFFCLSSQLDLIYTRYLNHDDEGLVYKSMNHDMDDQIHEAFEQNGVKKKEPVLTNVRIGDKPSLLGVVGAILITFFQGARVMGDARGTKFAIPVVILVFILSIFANRSKVTEYADSKEKPVRRMKMPGGEKMAVLFKPLAAILIAVAILVIKPVHDMYYYGGAILSLLLTLISVYDLVKGHNKLALRRPPQFAKRGGDV